MRIALIALALFAAGAAPDPSRVRLFGGRQGVQLLGQCSRAAPRANRVFLPDPAAVARAEAAVPPALIARESARARRLGIADTAALRRGWRVEATGLQRHGRRTLYLSFLPRGGGFDDATYPGPTVICDGGETLFGAEVDPRGAVLSLAFNGAV